MNPVSVAVRIGTAVLSTAAALAVRLLLDPVLGIRIPYATLYLSVTLSAVLCGTGAGVLALALGAAAATWFLVPPRGTLWIEGLDNRIGLVLYVVVSALLVLLSHWQRRARRRAEAAEAGERATRERFEVTLASIGDAVIATGADGRVTFMNGVAAALTGWPAAEAAGQSIETVFVIRNEQTGAAVENPATRAILNRRVTGLANHTVLISRDGRSIPIEDSGAPIVDASGQVIGAVMVFRDVSEARARQAVALARSRMIDLAHDAIIVADAEHRVKSWNGGARELYGWTESEARGQVLQHLLRTRAAQPLEEIGRVMRERGRWEGELVHTCKNGKTIIVESRLVLLRDGQQEIAGLLEINRDITARRELEERLRAALAQAEEGRRTLDALMASIPEGIAIADAPEGRFRVVSRRGAELLGRPRESLLGIPLAEQATAFGLYCADGQRPARPEELALARALDPGETTLDQELVIRRPDGTAIAVSACCAPIRAADGRITGGLVAWRDISERRKLEEKLREAAKLESLGILAGGIAHDFNNLLTGILGNASLLAEVLPRDGEAWLYAHGIAEAAERASCLTQQMLAYSGRGRFVVEPIDLSQYIGQVAALLESTIPKNVQLELSLEERPPLVEADGAQLQQLVMNLVINAAEAIDGAGCITIVTRACAADETFLSTVAPDGGLAPGVYVALEVHDTGCGMDAETLARAFDPFFTTKFTGRGLGLAAVQGIVRGHGGAIRFYSSPGAGTTARVLLPAAGVPAVEPRPAVSAVPVNGTGTVLVVDDEEVVRSTAKAALETLGYSVLLARDGTEALRTLRAAGGTVSLMLLDMTMPGPSPEEVLRQVREMGSTVPVLLSSGFSEVEASRRFAHYRLAGFLQKPYSLGTLAERVAAASRAAS